MITNAFSQIDLSRLAAPDVVEALDFETILAEMLADLRARDSAFSALTEADPAYKILEVAAYRELLIRQRINEAARGVMLAYATGSDLDQIAANFGVARLLIRPADDRSIPPTPAVHETDEELRNRVTLSLEGYTAAGSRGSYVYHALSASGDVKDVAVDSLTPGTVNVAVLTRTGTGGGADSEPTLSKYGLTDYAAPRVSPSITGGMTISGGATVLGGAAFSGTANVTAPRPANNDDSYKVATTSWVRQAMANVFEVAGFRIETRKSVTPGTIANPPRPISSTEGECGMIALPSFLGGLKFVWVNCLVQRHTAWREVMWIRPMNEVFTGGATAFAVEEHAVSIHPLPQCVRLTAFHRRDDQTSTDPVRVYAWAIGR